MDLIYYPHYLEYHDITMDLPKQCFDEIITVLVIISII